jgi:peptidoglycan/xylan/chitin deacetylase (PgdA/CDA1 family)
MRARLKAAAERALVETGFAAALRVARGRRTLVLAYHNVVPDGEAVPGMSAHMPVSDFRRQLLWLAERADVVPLREVLEDPAGARRPRVAITFDDGYRGALELAIPILDEHGLPATFFIAPGLLGAGSPWWDALPLEGWERFDTVFVQLQAREERVRGWANGQGMVSRRLPAIFKPGSVDEALSLAGHDRITVGAHSWSHPNLATLRADELDGELARPGRWIAERFPNSVPWVAYPYGLNSVLVREKTAAAGYEAGLTVQGGWMPRRGADRYALPRQNIPAGLSLRGFMLRLSGLFTA